MNTFQEWHEHFVSMVANKTTAERFHAMADLKETMAIHRNKPLDDPYNVKLHAEFDALIEAR